jgi:hypothetical protein
VAELGVDDRLAEGNEAAETFGVGGLDLGVAVVVDADDVELAPVDVLEDQGRVGERAVE